MWLVTPRKDARDQVMGSLINDQDVDDIHSRKPTAQASEHDECDAAKLLARALARARHVRIKFQYLLLIEQSIQI